MGNNWTKAQQRAIDIDGCNCLVAAAAGSGKTAVLVERIIKKITEKNIDADRLVVVTFTKAAAAEMKQRIREALDKLVEINPEDERLIRQLTLINNAQITTIDSFCLNIIRNYFCDINLDPGFKTADEGEIKLMENDVMEEMLEDYYSESSQDFMNFVDAYGSGKNDSNIVDIISKIYKAAISYPWPKEWLLKCQSFYEEDSCEIDKSEAFGFLYDYVKWQFNDYKLQYEKLMEICNEIDGPNEYFPMINADYFEILKVCECNQFEDIVKKIRGITFEALSRKKMPAASEEKKDIVKKIRNRYKDFIKDLNSKMFLKEYKDLIKDIKKSYPYIKVMIQLASEFYDRMQKEKSERNVLDFNDMEHFALDILVKKTEDGYEYTKTSDDLSEYYEEILIDEYQDSNLLQDCILTAVSKGKRQQEYNNIYMVGDVKQSIYKFRLACPELFAGKYNSYESDKSHNIKIELQNNFRSRKNVLECTNDVFEKAMNPSFGMISYNKKARLNPGLEYPECKDDKMISFDKDDKTEIIIIDTKENDTDIDSSKELEAYQISDMIKKLINQKEDGTYYCVFDKNEKSGYRRIKYSDIVVLTRTVNGWADVFVDTLMNQNIPAFCDVQDGYFNVREVKLFLNLLKLIDNPLQDIPAAAVMLSYFGGFDTDELTRIRTADKDKYLYEVLTEGDKYLTDENLCKKAKDFVNRIEKYRKKALLSLVSDFIWGLIYDTGYYDYTGTMPAGKQRQANLDMLISKAKVFEKTSYSGLFQFLRYIDRLQKYEIDFAEASIMGENENLVRVMSIHKSKGLEFPVVIVAGMGKKFNQMDARGEVLIDKDLGIGTNVFDLNKRIKNSSMIKSAVEKKISQENISEELRVLYVAMTRAREKLYMVGSVDNYESSKQTWENEKEALSYENVYSYLYESSMKTYFDVVMPAVYVCIDKNCPNGIFEIKESSAQQIIKSLEIVDNIEKNEKDENDTEKISDDENGEDIKLMEYKSTIPDIKPKVTVSELKKSFMEDDFDTQYHDAVDLTEKFEAEQKEEQKEKQKAEEKEEQKAEIEPIVPEFLLMEKKKLAGNERGTAYHRVMECMDFNIKPTLNNIKNFINELQENQKITKQQADSIFMKDIQAVLKSDMISEIKVKGKDSRVHKEQPFVFIDDSDPDNKGQLIQGVIDLYYENENGLVIVDYKTDNVDSEEELIKRYKIQLDYYGKALSQITGKKVDKKIIYSFKLNKEIILS